MERGAHRQVKLIYSSKYVSYRSQDEAIKYETHASTNQVNRFIKRLQSFGLEDYYVAILVDKFIYNKTMAEITAERGITSTGICYYLYTKAIELLRSKGFAVEDASDFLSE